MQKTAVPPRILIILHQEASSPGKLGQMLKAKGFELDIRKPRFAVSFNFDPTMNASQRRKVQKKWEEWWDKSKDAFGA
jgi:hypothetical protein